MNRLVLQVMVRAASLLAVVTNVGAAGLQDLLPISYTKREANNAVTQLQQKIDAGELRFHQDNSKAYLLAVLDELGVSADSQVLVFSKTSLQTKWISESTPRAIYFSDTTYVGYVPGGMIEVMTHDPELGMAFYTVRRPVTKKQQTTFKRENSCLRCHATHRTEGVPGAFIRSVKVGTRKEVIGPSFDVNHKTPFSQRWGGWYVTGDWGENRHRGNTPLLGKPELKESSLKQLDFLSDSYYPRKTSDVVALSVLEHQVYLHNLLIAAKMRYQRAYYLQQQSSVADSNLATGGASRALAERVAEELVEALLFCGEAKMRADGLSGTLGFTQQFKAGVKKNAKGKSLKDLRLYDRIFKYRCSYMIYHPAFEALPEVVKGIVLQRLRQVITSEDLEEKFQHLKASERKVIHSILSETLPGYGGA